MPSDQRPVLPYQTPAPPPEREDFPWGTVSFALGIGAAVVGPLVQTLGDLRYSESLVFIDSIIPVLSISATIGALASGTKRWRAILGVCLAFVGAAVTGALARDEFHPDEERSDGIRCSE